MTLDPVKFVNHADSHPDDPVLRVRPLDNEQHQRFMACLANRLGAEPTLKLADLLVALEEHLVPIEHVNADSPRFDPLSPVILREHQAKDRVFLSFADEDLWVISASDLRRYFSSVWYWGPDELFILDPDATWAIAVTQEGRVLAWI